MMRAATYSGYLKPFVPAILVCHKRGMTPRQIARGLVAGGVETPFSGKDEDAIRHMVAYILSDPAALPVQSQSPVLQRLRAQGLELRSTHYRSTRPIDMGGRRDHWHVWTPEAQFREFSKRAN